mgnify:CR=1 FL=1
MLIRSLLIKNPKTGAGFTIPITENLNDWEEQNLLYVSDAQVIDIQGLDPGIMDLSISKQSLPYSNYVSNRRFPARTLEFKVLAPNGNADALKTKFLQTCPRGANVDVYFASTGTSSYWISGVIQSVQYSKFSSGKTFSFSVICAEYPFFKENITLAGYPRGTKSVRRINWTAVPENGELVVTPRGTKDAGFLLEITLSAELRVGTQITVSDKTGRAIDVSGPVASGVTLRIDTGYQERAIRTGYTLAPQLIKVTPTTSWPMIPPPNAAGQSIIKIETLGGELNAAIRINWVDEVDGL